MSRLTPTTFGPSGRNRTDILHFPVTLLLIRNQGGYGGTKLLERAPGFEPGTTDWQPVVFPTKLYLHYFYGYTTATSAGSMGNDPIIPVGMAHQTRPTSVTQ